MSKNKPKAAVAFDVAAALQDLTSMMQEDPADE